VARSLRHLMSPTPWIYLAKPRSEEFTEFRTWLPRIRDHLHAAHGDEPLHLVWAPGERFFEPGEYVVRHLRLAGVMCHEPSNNVGHYEVGQYLSLIVFEVLLQHRDELAMAVDQSANHRDCVGAHPRIMPGARRLAHAARRVALGNCTYARPRT
jgi:hypothetical protein